MQSKMQSNMQSKKQNAKCKIENTHSIRNTQYMIVERCNMDVITTDTWYVMPSRDSLIKQKLCTDLILVFQNPI